MATTDTYRLVSLASLKNYLELPPTPDAVKDPVLTSIRDGVEDLLEAMTNQQFGPAAYGIVEIHDGTDTQTIYTRKPIADLTDITLTYGPLDAITTLSITSVAKWRVGHRRIKTIMYTFPYGTNNVQITYDSTANQPGLAVQGVLEAASVLWNRMGSEDARSEGIGTFSHVALRDLKESLLFSKAVDALSVFPMG